MLQKRFGKILCTLLALTMLLSLFPASAAGVEPADSVYRNAKIYTVNEDFDVVSAIAIKGDRLVYVGDEAGVDAYIGSSTKVVDLEGKVMVPGLVEGHMHVTGLGEDMLIIDAFWKPKDVILAAVKAEALKSDPGEWIQGSGWMNTVWENTDYPTKEELDAVAPDNPVFLSRACGHMGWANSMAFELAGITKDTPDPQGGEYLKNADGELQGCMTDTAMDPISALIPDFTVEEQREALLMAQEQLFSYGLTSAMDAGNSVAVYENVYSPLYESGELKLRVYGMISLDSLEGPSVEYIKAHPIDNENYENLFNNHLSLRCVKMFADGSLGARSAAMLEDYSDRPGHSGNYLYTQEQVDPIVKLAYDAGYQIATHAIGDGANHQMINAYEAAIKANPRDDHRLRIEHFQIVTQEDIRRALDLGILPSMQTTHATSDMLVAEDRMGAERLKGAYAWRTILDLGGIIPNGSDAPVELVNPYHGLYAAVTRTNRLGEPKGGWHIEEAMTREEALRSFTNWSAYAEFNEDIKGSLEVGKLADFAVLDRDVMTCPAEDIKDTQVLLTVSGGEVVYTRDPSTTTIMWNGLPLSFNSPLHIEPGVIYASLADLVNGLTATVTRDGDKAAVTVDGKTAEVTVKTVNGVEYVGVRALFEGLGRNVTWYGLSSCVSVGWLK